MNRGDALGVQFLRRYCLGKSIIFFNSISTNWGKEGIQKERNGVRECNGDDYDANALYICLKLSDDKKTRKGNKNMDSCDPYDSHIISMDN